MSHAKILVPILTAIVLSGCSSQNIQPADVDKSQYIAVKKVDHFLANNITVETSNFLPTIRRVENMEGRANLDNKNAKTAIENSLDSIGFMGGYDSEYTLNAKLEDSDLDKTFSQRFADEISINIEIEYSLEKDNEIIYNETIKSSATGGRPLFSFNVYNSEKRVVEKAYQNNFRQLIQDLQFIEK